MSGFMDSMPDMDMSHLQVPSGGMLEKVMAEFEAVSQEKKREGPGERGGSAGGQEQSASEEDGPDLDVSADAEQDVGEDADADAHDVSADMRTQAHESAEPIVVPAAQPRTGPHPVAAAPAKPASQSEGNRRKLPISGFRVEADKQPSAKGFPDEMMIKLRAQLDEAAVRVLKVTDEEATAFSGKLSQSALVTAFLLAQLDMRLPVDAATAQATELFRAVDPLLGAVEQRLSQLEQREAERDRLLGALRAELGEVHETAAVIEQGVAYTIADRTENFLRGSHDVHTAPITHKEALFVRDRARTMTAQQRRREQEKEGRPIR